LEEVAFHNIYLSQILNLNAKTFIHDPGEEKGDLIQQLENQSLSLRCFPLGNITLNSQLPGRAKKRVESGIKCKPVTYVLLDLG
jgi:hypothetical protein